MSNTGFHRPTTWAGLNTESSIHDFEDDEIIILNDTPTQSSIEATSQATNLFQANSPAKPKTRPVSGVKARRPNLFIEPHDGASDFKFSSIFEVDGKSYDVKLYHGQVVLSVIGGSRSSRGSVKRKHAKKLEGDNIELKLKDMIGATMRRAKPTKASGSKPGVCQGIELHTFSEKDANKLKHKIIHLVHPSEDLCHRWINEMNTFIRSIARRPRKMVLYVNPESGNQMGKHELKEKVLPLFEAAQVNLETIDDVGKKKVESHMAKLDLSNTDGVLVCGGDGTVNLVLNALLKRIQFDNGIPLKLNSDFTENTLPVGIIPTGHSNTICHTVNGTSDIITSVLNIIYGRTITTDVCSACDPNGMLGFCLSAHYGWGSTMMSLLERYRNLGPGMHNASVIKGITSSKLRAYGCQLKYVLANPKHGQPRDGTECRTGCTSCYGELATPSNDGSIYSDSLHEFDSLDQSNSSSQMSEIMMSEKAEGTVKGELLNVSILATPTFDDHAPLGLSKHTHMADGCLDLIMVQPAERKEFVRFLKRLGNAKNQMDLPFVECLRVKEVTFHVRMPVGWSFRDVQYSEMNDQARNKKPGKNSSKSKELVLDEDSTTISTLTLDSDVSDDGSDSQSVSSFSRSIATSSVSGDHNSLNDSKDGAIGAAGGAGHVHIIHRYTETERRQMRQRKKEMKKEVKAKCKEENAMKSTWRLDSTKCDKLDVTFKCHHKLTRFFGTGLSPKTEPDEVKCFGAI